ncbi:MAG: short-chain dehydrogenase/reductase [Pseudomonas sp.]|nr:short-chain dehydrogenase/reductase [Pseudomonas sp.]
MNCERGRVAVITGAASGIGRGLAEHAAQLGMRLVLSDLDEAPLQKVCRSLSARGVEVLACVTDVSDPQQVDQLRDAALARFAAVDLLFNNAGVMQTGFCWELTHAQWQRMLQVNLQGVINGIRSFVPLLLEQGRPAHVINTASIAGLLSSPMMAPYNVTKQAVVALSETLHYELALLQSQVSVSVVCPGAVATEIMASNQITGKADAALLATLDARIREGMTPSELAAQVFAAIHEKRFWVFPHPSFKSAFERRVRSILEETNPQYSMAEAPGEQHGA